MDVSKDYDLQHGCDFFTKDGMPKTPFPNGWKGEKGLYTVGFIKRGLLGTASDAMKIADDIAKQWRAGWNEDDKNKSSYVIFVKEFERK